MGWGWLAGAGWLGLAGWLAGAGLGLAWLARQAREGGCSERGGSPRGGRCRPKGASGRVALSAKDRRAAQVLRCDGDGG